VVDKIEELLKKADKVAKISSHEVGLGCRCCKSLVWQNIGHTKLIAEMAVVLKEREQGFRRFHHTTPECGRITEFYPSDVVDGDLVICKGCGHKLKIHT